MDVVDMDLVQALHQTQDHLSRKDELTEDERAVQEGVSALLAHYREGHDGDVAYAEEGADRIDRTGGGSTDDKEQVQAALIAYAEQPTSENATHVTEAIDRLRQSV